MVCKKCYYNNDENAKFCIKCGEKLEPEVSKVNTQNSNSNNQNINYNSKNVTVNTPDNNVINYSSASAIAALILSILCCSSIPGIVFAILALVEGGKINTAIIQGNMEAAKYSFEQSKKWTKYAWISMVIWAVVIGLIYVLYFAFIFGIAFISEM